MDFFATGLMGGDIGEESDEFGGGVFRAVVLTSASPVLGLKAAYSEGVPRR
jgi:hypothetical protein